MKIQGTGQGIASSPSVEETKDPLRQVAQSYESLFVNQLVGAMRKTVQKGNLIPESNAERIFQAMLDQQYSQKIAESGELGIAKQIYEHLLRSGQ